MKLLNSKEPRLKINSLGGQDMSKIDDILETIKAGIIQVSKEKAMDFIKQAESDGNAFLESIKDDLKEWSNQLMDGDLSKEDFEFLVRGKRDLATMNALTQAGYAEIKIDQIRTSIIDLIVNAVRGVL